jgi:hypothetical protein
MVWFDPGKGSNMPIDSRQFLALQSGNPAAVMAAECVLLAEGFSFIGFHGTNLIGQMSLVPYGFDPTRAGTGGG